MATESKNKDRNAAIVIGLGLLGGYLLTRKVVDDGGNDIFEVGLPTNVYEGTEVVLDYTLKNTSKQGPNYISTSFSLKLTTWAAYNDTDTSPMIVQMKEISGTPVYSNGIRTVTHAMPPATETAGVVNPGVSTGSIKLVIPPNAAGISGASGRSLYVKAEVSASTGKLLKTVLLTKGIYPVAPMCELVSVSVAWAAEGYIDAQDWIEIYPVYPLNFAVPTGADVKFLWTWKNNETFMVNGKESCTVGKSGYTPFSLVSSYDSKLERDAQTVAGGGLSVPLPGVQPWTPLSPNLSFTDMGTWSLRCKLMASTAAGTYALSFETPVPFVVSNYWIIYGADVSMT
jgi:hypothetical protein